MSSSTSREERERRQQRDDGDPADTVYVKQSATSTNGTSTAYHESLDCYQARGTPSEYNTPTREQACDQWLTPCQMCVLDAVDNSPGTRPCPFCGGEFMDLPAHLPCPDQGGEQ